MLLIGQIAKMFGVLPSVVAADLDNDSSELTMQTFEALMYAETKRVFDTAKDKTKIDPFMKDPVMRAVVKNTFEIAKERRRG